MISGEQRAFDEFFHASASRLAAFAMRRSSLVPTDVEDIVQNTLIKAVRNLATYRGDASLFTWLTQICRHELADVSRKAARQPMLASLDVPYLDDDVTDKLRVPASLEPAAEADAGLRRAAVIRTLNALPRSYAVALEAKYGDGMSVDEIAEFLGLTPVATQSLLARAREAFRGHWGSSGDCYD
jgi:RNA polymerase sigma-70 factor (ECF subfamily)